MSLYKELFPLINYIKQVRKLDEYIIFDMSFPNSWKIPKKFIIEDKFVNYGNQDDETTLLSFLSTFAESEIEVTKTNILGIIKFNLEREEKERLLDIKILELKNMFDKQTLDNLKNLKFSVTQNKNIIIDNEQEGKVDGLVEIIDGAGQE